MRAKVKRVIKFCFSSKLTFTLFAEIVISTMVSLIAVLAFFKLADDVLQKEVLAIDAAITNIVVSHQPDILTNVMYVITNFGSPYVLLLGSAILCVYLYNKKKKDVLIFLTIFSTGVVINFLLKEFFQRPRPDQFQLLTEYGFSFPSGHAMNSFVFYSAVAYFILRSSKNIKLSFIASLVCAAIITAIGASRVYLGVHYLSDVLAGYIAGFLWFNCAILLEKTIIISRLYKAVTNNNE